MGILIKNGTIVSAADKYVGDVYCDGDKIVAVGTGVEKQNASDVVIDASGQFVFPGGVDAHARPVPVEWVEGERHAGRPRVHHLLHRHRHLHLGVVVTHLLAVGDRPVGEQRHPAVPDPV